MEVVGWMIDILLVAGILVVAATAPKAGRPVRKPVPVPVYVDDGKPRR